MIKKVIAFFVVMVVLLYPSLCFSDLPKITGKVTDIETGLPIVKAFVIAFRVERIDLDQKIVRTSSDGSYLIENLKPGNYFVAGYAFGYQTSLYPDTLRITESDSLSGIDFQLTPKPNGKVMGTVTDTQNGQPIYKAKVFLRKIKSCEKYKTSTDPNGNYLLERVIEGDYITKVKAKGYKNFKSPDTIHVLDQQTSVANFQLEKKPRKHSGIMAGIVKDEVTQLPLEDAILIAIEENKSDQSLPVEIAFTDENGYFIFDDLPETGFKLFAWTDEYIGEFYPNSSLFETATIVVPDETNLNIALSPSVSAPLSIGGTISENSIPEDFAVIYALTPDGQVVGSTFTEFEGFFTLENLPPGDYSFMATSDDGSVEHKPPVHIDFRHICGIDINLGRLDVKPESKTNLPRKLTLAQNYPNPFNPETFIEYSLSKSSFVRLTIYNIVGQKIKTLVNKYEEVGDKKIIWNGTDANGNSVATGIYFYRLETDQGAITRRMVLIK